MISLYNNIDLSDYEHLFQTIHSKNFNEKIHVTVEKNDCYLEVSFDLIGYYNRFYRLIIEEINISEFNLWKSDTEKKQLNQKDFNDLTEVLKQKINELI